MKKLMNLFVLFMLSICLFGCASNGGYTYNFDVTETGDTINILFDTDDGYYIEEYDTASLGLDSQVFVVCDSEANVVSIGSFVPSSDYATYNWSILMDEDASMLDSNDTEGENNYIMWSYGDLEFNYIIQIEGSSTCIQLGNDVSLESAQDIFERMTITVD